jgi:hypothetical protein
MERPMQRVWAGIGAAAALAGCAATPEPVVFVLPETPPPLVTIAAACNAAAALDADADGWLGLFEFAGYAQTAFPAWDGDGDRALTPAEFAACWLPDPSAPAGAAPEAVFAAWDANGDGALTPEEFFAWTAFEGVRAVL